MVGFNPKEPLAKISNKYVKLDYSNHHSLREFIKEKKFDHVIPGCTDASYNAYTNLSNEQFQTIDSTKTFHSLNNKKEFRKVLEKLNIKSPQEIDKNNALSYPAIIIKPADSYSGKGITKLNSPHVEELDKAISYASNLSNSGGVVVEEFVEGQLYSHSCFIDTGNIVADFIVHEDCISTPFAVDASYVEDSFSKNTLQTYRRAILNIIQYLGIKQGLLHTQFILSGSTFWLIEATRRCPGDLYSLLIEKSTGYQYCQNYLAPFLGEKVQPFNLSKSIKRRIIRYTLSPKNVSTLESISFSKELKIDEFYPLVSIGENLQSGPAGRTALIFFESENLPSLKNTYSSLLDGTLCSINKNCD